MPANIGLASHRRRNASTGHGPAAGRRRDRARSASASSAAGAGRPLVGVVDPGRARDQHQRVDQVGTGQSQVEAEPGPHRVARGRRPGPRPPPSSRAPSTRVGGHRRTSRRARACPPAPPGGRGQVGVHRAPHPSGLGEAVGQHQARARRPWSRRGAARPVAGPRVGGRGWASVGMGGPGERTEPARRSRRCRRPGRLRRHPGRRVGAGRRGPRRGVPGVALDAAGRGPGRPRRAWPSTSAWTSARPGSPPSGSGWPPAARPWCSPPAARPRPSSTPRWSRPTWPGSRSSPAPPTDRPSCATSGRPRPSTRPTSSGASVRWFADPGVPDRRRPVVVAVAGRPGGGRGPVGRRRPRSGPSQPALPGAAARRPGGRRRGDPGPAGGRALAPGGGRRRPPRPTRRGPALVGGGTAAARRPGGDRGRRRVRRARPRCWPWPTLLGWPVLADPRSGLRRPRPGVVGGRRRHPPLGAVRRRPPARVRAPAGRAAGCPRWSTGSCPRAAGGAPDIVVVDPWGRWPDPEREAADLRPGRPRPRSAGRWPAGSPSGDRRPVGGRPAGAVVGRAGSRPRPGPGGHRTALLGGPGGAGAADRAVAGPPPLRPAARPAPPWWCRPPCPSGTSRPSPAPRHRPPRVVANRGANGIDGVVSTALGVALASAGPDGGPGRRPGLPPRRLGPGPGAEGLDADLTVVVADNGGGGIFSFLDPASSAGRRRPSTRLFGTPQAPDVAAVAAGFGWPVDDVGPDAGRPGWRRRWTVGWRPGRPSVIRVRLPGRAENVAVHRRINAAIVDAVDATGRRRSGSAADRPVPRISRAGGRRTGWPAAGRRRRGAEPPVVGRRGRPPAAAWSGWWRHGQGRADCRRRRGAGW